MEKCVEQIEEYDQAVEVQQYETEVMVNGERTPENVSPRSLEPRLVAEKKINQAKEKANEEMGDALQRGAQELSNVTRKFESKRMDYKQKVKIVQDRTQEVGDAAAKEINKKRSGFDKVDSEGKVLFSFAVTMLVFYPCRKKKRGKTEEYVTILVNMDNNIIMLLLNRHLEVLRLFCVIQLNPLVIIVTANIGVN